MYVMTCMNILTGKIYKFNEKILDHSSPLPESNFLLANTYACTYCMYTLKYTCVFSSSDFIVRKHEKKSMRR